MKSILATTCYLHVSIGHFKPEKDKPVGPGLLGRTIRKLDDDLLLYNTSNVGKAKLKISCLFLVPSTTHLDNSKIHGRRGN